MDILCARKSCSNVLATAAGRLATLAAYGHRYYGFAALLTAQCDLCGSAWTRPHFDARRDLCPNPVYATLRCPCADCKRNILGQVAADHALIVHEGRTMVVSCLSYVSCEKCRRGYDVRVAPIEQRGGAPVAPVVTLTASD